MNRNQVSAAVYLSMDVLFAQPSIDGERNVGGDVSIAGVHVEIGGKVAGQFQSHAPVAGAQGPA